MAKNPLQYSFSSIWENGILNLSELEPFLNAIQAGIQLFDLNGQILFSNLGISKLFGFGNEELIGKSIDVICSDNDAVSDIIIPQIRKSGLWEGELTVKHKNGTYFSIWLSASLVRDAKGEAIAFLGISRDVTNLKKTEQKLLLETEFRNAIENSIDAGIVAVDLAGTQTYVNPGFCKMVGWTRKELMGGLPPYKYWPAEEMEKIEKTLLEHQKSKISVSELKFIKKNGSCFDSLVMVSPLKDVSGNLSGWLFSVFDISERKKAERELKERANLDSLGHEIGKTMATAKSLDKMLEYICESFISHLNLGCVVFWKGKGADKKMTLSAYRISSEISESDWQYFKEEIYLPLAIDESKVIKANDSISIFKNYDWLSRNKITELIFLPLIINKKQLGLISLFSRESLNPLTITMLNSLSQLISVGIMRKEFEMKILDYNEELKESNLLKGMFADILGHDLINPVTIAMGYLELSLEENKNREIIPYLTKIEESLIIIRKIIENARLFAKLQNTDELDREDLDISRLIKDSMSAMNSQAHKKKIRINFIGSDGLVLQANDNLGRVFSNLLSNAIKFSPSQSQILVSLTELPSKVLIQVKDQGPGIPDEHKSKIFQRLEKLDCKNEGSGLGLFIVKKILDLHHGKVWIDDNPDGGSIFNVELPIN